MERFIPRLQDKQEISLPQKRWFIGKAAANLEKQWHIQRSLGDTNVFLDKLTTTIIENQDRLPSLFTAPGIPINGRRQPSFVEAVVETSRRLQFLEQLVNIAPESVRGIMLGGSISYGKFYCVRGAPDPSDIDIFYIVDPEFFTQKEASKAFNSTVGINQTQSERFYERAARFPELLRHEQAELMSEKFQVKDFVLSAKILPTSTFHDEFNTRLASIPNDNGSQIKPILDYKHELYPINLFSQYNFLGEPYLSSVSQSLQADGSSIAGIPSIIVVNGHLYTGDHHNHVFPKYEVMLDRDGNIVQTMQRFEGRLSQRVKQERKHFERNAINIDVLNAHDRKSVFSPQVLEEARRKFR